MSVFIELRSEAISAVLAEQDKTDWAAEEFEYLRRAENTPTRRRTDGGGPLGSTRSGPAGLAAVRSCGRPGTALPAAAISPRRILPDSAIIAAAAADPKTVEEPLTLPVFGGQRQRRGAPGVARRAGGGTQQRRTPDTAEQLNGLPAVRWAKRKPEAAARLEAAKSALTELSRRVTCRPRTWCPRNLVRRLCWDWVGRPATGTQPWRRSCARPGHGSGSGIWWWLARALTRPAEPT